LGEGVSVVAAGEGRINGAPVPVVPIDRARDAPREVIIAVTRETPVRALIQARLNHSGPFLVKDGQAIAGVIRDEDLFRCLVHGRSVDKAEPIVLAAMPVTNPETAPPPEEVHGPPPPTPKSLEA
jgi:hypothetical protein